VEERFSRDMIESLIFQARAARPQIMIGGVDYYEALAPYHLSFSYTDSCDGEKADSIEIELSDRDREFIGPSFPQKTAFFDCTILCSNWRFPGDNVGLDCGRFFIDSVDFRGPPNTLSIRANSVPSDSEIKATQKTRAWENTTLQQVAEQIASENEMTVEWESEQNPRFKRLDQTESSALAFLKGKGKDAGVSIKVSKRKIIFFDEEKMEAKEPSFELVYGQNVRQWNFSTKYTDTAKKATVSYINPETGRLTQEEFEDPKADDFYLKSNLWINENPGFELDDPNADGDGGDAFVLVPSIAPLEDMGPGWNYTMPDTRNDSARANRGKGAGARKVAKHKAKKELRDKNKEGTKAGDKSNTFGIELMGNPLIAAGQTCLVRDFGFYDGKYFVVSARHKIDSGGGYDLSLSIRKCLEGY
jgi:uncharacterized protein